MLRSMSDPPLPPLQSARLLDQVRERVRYLHYSLRTEQAYVHWVQAFVRHQGMRHLREMGHSEVLFRRSMPSKSIRWIDVQSTDPIDESLRNSSWPDIA